MRASRTAPLFWPVPRRKLSPRVDRKANEGRSSEEGTGSVDLALSIRQSSAARECGAEVFAYYCWPGNEQKGIVACDEVDGPTEWHARRRVDQFQANRLPPTAVKASAPSSRSARRAPDGRNQGMTHELQHPRRRRRARCRRDVSPMLSPRGAAGHLCPAFRRLGRGGGR